jgi:hypothetical protein
MNDRALKAALEREERVYEELLQVRASLGTMLAEAIRTDEGLPEFSQRREDLLLLIQRADIRRTELKVELLGRELKKAQKEHRRAVETAKRAAASLEEARRSYPRAANIEQEWGLETRRLEELHREELARLKRLRSEEPPPEPSEASQTATEQPERVVPQAPLEGSRAEPTEPRSWWRRIFGGLG